MPQSLRAEEQNALESVNYKPEGNSRLFADADGDSDEERAARRERNLKAAQERRLAQAKDLMGHHQNMLRVKRGQFRYKLASLQRSIDEAQGRISRIARFKQDANEKLKRLDRRIRKIHAELDRAKTFQGTSA